MSSALPTAPGAAAALTGRGSGQAAAASENPLLGPLRSSGSWRTGIPLRGVLRSRTAAPKEMARC